MNDITDPQHELIFDDTIDLLGENTAPGGLTYTLATEATNATWGNPAPVDVAIEGWFRDGAFVSNQSSGNRELYVLVQITADDSTSLAAGEADLFSRCDQRTTLAWTPPQGSVYAATTVFDVWVAHLEHTFDDMDELRLTRTYGLRMTAKPFSRSDATVTVGFPANGSVATTTIDACTSTTNWTGGQTAGSGVVSTSGGAVLNTVAGAPVGQLAMSLIRTAAITMTGFDTLVVQATVAGLSNPRLPGDSDYTRPPSIRAYVDGTELVLRAQANGIYWFACPGNVASNLTLYAEGTVSYTSQVPVLAVQDVSKGTAAGAGLITSRQLLRRFPIEGSARTTGSIVVNHPTDALGDLLVWTATGDTGGYTPGLRGGGYRVSGPHTPTSDSSTTSGAYEDITSTGAATSVRFQIPANKLREAEYGVVIRAKAGTAGRYPIFFAAYLTNGVGGTLAAGETVTFAAHYDLTTSFGMVLVGNWTLPPAALDPAYTGFVRVDISADPGSSSGIFLDEIIMVNLTNGSLTLTDSSGYLQTKIDGTDGTRLQPTIWMGSDPNLTDSIAASLTNKVKAFGTSAAGGQGGHVLPAGDCLVYVATGGAATPGVAITYYPRWFTHAAS